MNREVKKIIKHREYRLTQNSVLKDGKIVITIPLKDCEVAMTGFGLKRAKEDN